MKRLFVKMQTDPSAKPVIMELPGEIPVKDIIPNLLQSEGWEMIEDGEPVLYWFETDKGPIELTKTLSAAGVRNGSLLVVKKSTGKSSEGHRIPALISDIPQNIGPKDVRSTLTSPLKGMLRGKLANTGIETNELGEKTEPTSIKGSMK